MMFISSSRVLLLFFFLTGAMFSLGITAFSGIVETDSAAGSAGTGAGFGVRSK